MEMLNLWLLLYHFKNSIKISEIKYHEVMNRGEERV